MHDSLSALYLLASLLPVLYGALRALWALCSPALVPLVVATARSWLPQTRFVSRDPLLQLRYLAAYHRWGPAYCPDLRAAGHDLHQDPGAAYGVSVFRFPEGWVVLLLAEEPARAGVVAEGVTARGTLLGCAAARQRAFRTLQGVVPHTTPAGSARRYRDRVVAAPGRGCSPQAWAFLHADVQTMLDTAQERATRGLPVGRCYLLVGPPGTGKSTLALHLAVAHQLTIHVGAIRTTVASGPQPGEPATVELSLGYVWLWPGVVDRAPTVEVRAAITVLDDLDRLLGGIPAQDPRVAALLSALDDALASATVVIATANSTRDLDSALLSRFQVVHVDAPPLEQLAELLAAYTPATPETCRQLAAELHPVADLRALRRALERCQGDLTALPRLLQEEERLAARGTA